MHYDAWTSALGLDNAFLLVVPAVNTEFAPILPREQEAADFVVKHFFPVGVAAVLRDLIWECSTRGHRPG